ncbi:hypothetical protein TWF696_008743 [Orbilia brochopaga]|uniref:Putative transcription factor kapC n=1 Tax=Orbilia brochopaga TaxID=3140254 RepID=A0AAV9UGR7_9PEZI
MAEVVAMANGHRTLPAPTLTSAQDPQQHQQQHQQQQQQQPQLLHQPQQQPPPPPPSSQQHTPLSLNHHPHHHQPSAPQPQQQPTPSSSAEPTKRSGPMDSDHWGIDPHLGKDAEMLIRKQLLSAISGDDQTQIQQQQQLQQQQLQQVQPQQPTPMSSQQPPNSSPTMIQHGDVRPSSSLSPGSGGEDSHAKADSRQKRELNTSKRAAQNRNAQRAFRARKEEYIKSLESKVRDYEAVEERSQALEGENAALRQYIMHLQRRLLDHLGEGEALPDPPAGLNIEALHISSRPGSGKLSMKPTELPPFAAFHEKTLPEPVAGVKRARVDE